MEVIQKLPGGKFVCHMGLPHIPCLLYTSEQCWDMLRRKVSDARALLPEGATTPIVKDDFGNVYGLSLIHI